MIDLIEIEQRIMNGENIEEIIKEINWKDFEALVGKILKRHDFHFRHSFRFKTKRRYEIDVVAIKENVTLVVDCKRWSRGRNKKSGLRNAIKRQNERVSELKNFLKNNPIAQGSLKIKLKAKFLPLIITWWEEDLIEHENAFVVPIWKLNEFLLNSGRYI